MRNLREIRQAYEENYRQMLEVIQQMGGDHQIKFHRSRKTALYRRLKELQRREHHLDQLENRLRAAKGLLH
ncbi:MAG: hypothetical protein D6715_12645 [Calditrichaeota bacterium]|nr:MAG: hypothetical protein D6715_12645 [Calditrichota bacterium]